MARTDKQINIRRPPEEYEILEAAAFVFDKGSASKLVDELVGKEIAKHRGTKSVQNVIAERRKALKRTRGSSPSK